MPADVLFWMLVLAIPAAAGLWAAWEHLVVPGLVSRREIAARADALEGEFGTRALAVAQDREAAAHARGDATEQGLWRRVAALLERRASARGRSP